MDGFKMKCPECESIMEFKELDNSIRVNIESDQGFHVPGMLSLYQGCENPMCKWSSVDEVW